LKGREELLMKIIALVGTVEELAQSSRTQSLTRDQFEINFFSNVNIIKAILPTMRSQKNGHIIMLTGISGHLGTPGLGMYCASQWALEGYCDSLAYEIAPFNIKMTIVQPNLEIGVLTNRITSAPPLEMYTPDVNPAPLSRDILSSLLDKLEGTVDKEYRAPTSPFTATANADAATPITPHSAQADTTTTQADDGTTGFSTGDLLHASGISSFYPPLQPAVGGALVAETVYAIAAIGGHDNPPARHIVGFEGVVSVKEKLKTVSEELEDFVETSSAADFGKSEIGESVVIA